ncbi:MAG: hypothetical protein GWP08_11650 [Nitrospiraceae bacterium]|nr:hypothetical protein [Nitrospiraceae bacterium]
MMRGTRHNIPDPYIFFVCEKFLENEGATQIAKWLRDQGFTTVTRERIYSLIREGKDLGYIRLCPPEEMALNRRLAAVFPQAAADISVLNVQDEPGAVNHLTMAGAEKALVLVKELGNRKDMVHIGLGAGGTTERFARHFASLLRSQTQSQVPKLVLHALSSGFAPRHPITAPVAFFSYFMALNLDIDYMGMFSEPVVPWNQYEAVKTRTGVREAFEAAEDIDIIVSSLSSRDDEHGLFINFLESNETEAPRARGILEEAGWCGDVQWRPYSNKGPIMEDIGARHVTLFELEDLVRLSRTPDKHVILISGRCVQCNTPKNTALLPLMREESLRVFNHLITDITTATQLLNNVEDSAP